MGARGAEGAQMETGDSLGPGGRGPDARNSSSSSDQRVKGKENMGHLQLASYCTVYPVKVGGGGGYQQQ